MGRQRRPPEEHVATVDSLSHDGRGVARVEGRVCFIAGALPGETVRFSSLRKRRSWVVGRLEEVVEPSPERVAPRCAVFGVCGGCALQHLLPRSQIEAKQRTLFDNLERIGKVEPGTRYEPITGPLWHYRRKARLGVRLVPKKGGVLVGFRERDKSYITSLTECHTLVRPVSDLLPPLHELVSGLSRPDRIPQIETAAADNALALVFRHLEPFSGDDLTRLGDFGRIHGLQIFLQPGGLDTVAPLWPREPEPLHYDLPDHGLRMRFQATDFIQVNAAVNRKLIGRALELLGPRTGERILDLFCGLGNFTLPVARSGATVTGVEGEAALVTRAQENAAANGLDNAVFLRADLHREAVGEILPGTAWDKLLLDPPRSGAVEVVKQLVPRLRPERVVYVSCNPATLARDAAIMVRRNGYRLAGAGIIDMFPHTAHIESIALFLREG